METNEVTLQTINSDSIEYIYNTPTIGKMRQISEKKWYHLL